MTVSSIVSRLWSLFFLGLLSVVLLIFLVYIDFLGLFGGMPSLEKLSNPRSELSSVVYSADGKMIGKYFRENRTPAVFEELSPNLIKALYATEDIRFDRHSGIDLKGISAIAYYLVRGDRRGSSTLTQQLAKNLFSTRGEIYDGLLSNVPGLGTVIVKIKEWVVAIQLEKSYTKQEIITMYLNTVPFGSNAFGIKTAARTYFNTSPNKLTVNQSAMLVGLLKAPSLYSPVYNPERALKRRNVVLNQMKRYGFLDMDQFVVFSEEPIGLKYNVENHNDGSGTYFRAELRKDLITFCKENRLDLFADGLKVYTTIDSRLQAAAEAAVTKHMKYQQKAFNNYWGKKNPWTDENGAEIKDFLVNAAKRTEAYREFLAQTDGNHDAAMAMMKRPYPMRVFSYYGERDTVFSPIDSIRYYKRFLHAGLLSMEPQSGHIKAWVGGINYKYFKYDHVRQGKRQPGSSFKPILYAAAMDNGFTPCVTMLDAPVTFVQDVGEPWTPKNSDGVFTGERLTLRQALARSINSVAAALLKQVGIPTVVKYAEKLGIESTLDPVPALCLGASDVSLFELLSAYGVFVNQGEWTKPFYITRIEDRHGNVLRRFTPEKKEVLNKETAYVMLYMLQGATKERNGTALGLYRLGKTLYGNEVAAKTGTTSNYSDGWFFGLTKNLVTGVWVGGDDRSIHFRSSNLGQGARMAMPIWSYYMDAVYADTSLPYKKGSFPKPENLSISLDCAQGGKTVAPSSQPNQPAKKVEED